MRETKFTPPVSFELGSFVTMGYTVSARQEVISSELSAINDSTDHDCAIVTVLGTAVA